MIPIICYQVSFTILSIIPISGTPLVQIIDRYLLIESNDLNDINIYTMSVKADLEYGHGV